MDARQRAIYLIEHNNFMVVATADKAGKPWISPVGFSYDEAFNLYWISAENALHSANLRDRPQVAIVIYGQLPEGPFDGVYFDATAAELTDTGEIEAGLAAFSRRPGPPKFVAHSVSDVTGQAAWRMYKATALSVSKRADTVSMGQAITIREAVEL